MTLDFLEEAKFVVNGLPWGEDKSSDYKIYNFNESQFQLSQIACGSELSADFAESVQFVVDRETKLVQQAIENQQENGWFQPFGDYCRSGIYDSEGSTIIWYETTSGTIYAVNFVDSKSQDFSVYLPLSRATSTGNTHRHLEYVAAGMTVDQYHDWYDNYRSDKGQSYSDQVAFHNNIGVLEPMESLADRELRCALRDRQREAEKLARRADLAKDYIDDTEEIDYDCDEEA